VGAAPAAMGKSRAAITEDLRQRIVTGVHLGTLRPGERLPSLRDLGAELNVDPRTIMGAYRQLAAEGLVRLLPRSGVFVAPSTPTGDELLPEVAAWVVDFLLRGLTRDIPPTELRRQARACLDTVRVRAACLECNEDQIYSLSQQVRADYGFEAVAVDTADLAGRRPLPPGAADADLVLTTRFHTAEAERLGRRLRRPVIVATLDPVFVNEVTRMMAAGRVWWICTDPRFAAKVPTMFGAPVLPVVLGRVPPEDIPPGDMVYATRRAADRLPAGWRGGRVVTVPRVFSAETARALLVFLVKRNLAEARASVKSRVSAGPRAARRWSSRP